MDFLYSVKRSVYGRVCIWHWTWCILLREPLSLLKADTMVANAQINLLALTILF